MAEDSKLSDSDGAILVRTARKAVTEFLSNGNKIKLEPEFEKKFSFNSGVFVTTRMYWVSSAGKKTVTRNRGWGYCCRH